MIGYFGLVVLALFQLNLSEACRKYVPVAKDSAQDRELYSSFIDAIDTDMRNPCNNFYKYACDCYDETNKNSRSRTSRYYHLQHQVKGEKEQLIMDTSRLAYRSQQEGVIRRMLKFRDMCLNTGKSSSECFKDVDQFFYLVVDHLYISSSSVGKSPEVIGYVTNMIENIKASFRLMLKANKKWLDGKGLRGEKVWKGIDPKTGKSVHDTPYEHAKRKIDNMRYIIGGYTYIMNVANLNDIHRNYQIDSTLSYQEVKEKLEQLRRKRDSITSLPADVVGHSIPDGVNMDGFAPSKAADYCNQVTPKDTRISDVNARYDPKLNTFVINYPMLQKPFFDLDYPDAVNYGRLGSIIGHEITHGFDTKGAQNDVNEEGSPWMRGSPYDEFMRRVQKETEFTTLLFPCLHMQDFLHVLPNT
ncbi:Endothelin-converting enzyme 1 isoform X3 [Aphelenchoides bicaudatus]|nr:Endothelin-converting enzyme 1 isoform X3 [Aphelenchoides bicaudatus]